MTAPILTLSVDQMGIQALANLLRAIAEDYPLGIVEGTAGGLEVYPHGVGSRRAPFELEEPPAAAPVLPGTAAPYHRCAVDGCGKSFPTRFGAEVHQRRMHKPKPPEPASDPVAKPEAPQVNGPASDPVAKPEAPQVNGRVENHAAAVDLIEAPALPVSSWCRRGECLSCKKFEARCGHNCHPDSRQLPPGAKP